MIRGRAQSCQPDAPPLLASAMHAGPLGRLRTVCLSFRSGKCSPTLMGGLPGAIHSAPPGRLMRQRTPRDPIAMRPGVQPRSAECAPAGAHSLPPLRRRGCALPGGSDPRAAQTEVVDVRHGWGVDIISRRSRDDNRPVRRPIDRARAATTGPRRRRRGRRLQRVRPRPFRSRVGLTGHRVPTAGTPGINCDATDGVRGALDSDGTPVQAACDSSGPALATAGPNSPRSLHRLQQQ